VASRRRKPAPHAAASATRVVRRRDGAAPGLRKLPPDFEDLAAGRRDVLRPRHKPRGRIGDTRIAGLVAGVANHEARRVYDARVELGRKTLESGSEAELGKQLFDAVRMGLWRARNVTGFEAFAHHVLGVELDRATRLAERCANEHGATLEQLPDIAVALWMRSEAALLERCPEATIDVRVENEKVLLSLVLPLAPPVRAAEAVASIGRSAAGLARVLLDERGPREGGGGDRPRGRDRDRD
jgi:hypothetical protein